jgi:hypothetical protein
MIPRGLHATAANLILVSDKRCSRTSTGWPGRTGAARSYVGPFTNTVSYRWKPVPLMAARYGSLSPAATVKERSVGIRDRVSEMTGLGSGGSDESRSPAYAPFG